MSYCKPSFWRLPALPDEAIHFQNRKSQMTKVKTKVWFALEQMNQPPEVKPYLVPLTGQIPVFTFLLDLHPPRLVSGCLCRVLPPATWKAFHPPLWHQPLIQHESQFRSFPARSKLRLLSFKSLTWTRSLNAPWRDLETEALQAFIMGDLLHSKFHIRFLLYLK